MKQYQFWAIIMFLMGIALLVMNVIDVITITAYAKTVRGYGILGFFAVVLGLLTAIIGSIKNED